MQRIKALIAMLCILTLQGCLNSHGTSQIRGGSKGSFVNGSLSTLDLQSPVDEVVVAVVYPRPVDMNWFDGTASGTGDDNRNWKEEYKVRLQGGTKPEVLTIKWEYSIRTRKLTIAGAQFDLPKGTIGVITFDEAMKPTCEIRDNLPAVIESLKKDLGSTDAEGVTDAEEKPARPLRDMPDLPL